MLNSTDLVADMYMVESSTYIDKEPLFKTSGK